MERGSGERLALKRSRDSASQVITSTRSAHQLGCWNRLEGHRPVSRWISPLRLLLAELKVASLVLPDL